MRRLALAAALAALCAPATAAARPSVEHAFQVNVTTSPRMWEDVSALQFSHPLSLTVRVHGTRHRKVPFSAYTISRESIGAALRESAGRYNEGNAFIERPLKQRERRKFRSQLVWIDGDVLAVHPTDPLCASGMSLSAVRKLLTSPTGDKRIYVPAGLTGDPEHLFGIKWTATGPNGYGRGVQAVVESSAVRAVGSSPGMIAAVAWSAARDALAAGAVCAVPIGGVAPTEATLRSRKYPAAVHATFVYKRRGGFFGVAHARKWYLKRLRSGAMQRHLTTSRGRERLLP
jgi:hypothetical protein